MVFVKGFDDLWNDAILASSFVISELVEAFIEHDEADFFVVFMFSLELLQIFFNVFKVNWVLGIVYFFKVGYDNIGIFGVVLREVAFLVAKSWRFVRCIFVVRKFAFTD